jgi:hypothetical protein
MSNAQAWAYATASEAAPQLFDAIAASAEGRVERFIAQNLANTAWAFATASHRAPRLLDAVAREAARRADEFKPQELANTVTKSQRPLLCATSRRRRDAGLGLRDVFEGRQRRC